MGVFQQNQSSEPCVFMLSPQVGEHARFRFDTPLAVKLRVATGSTDPPTGGSLMVGYGLTAQRVARVGSPLYRRCEPEDEHRQFASKRPAAFWKSRQDLRGCLVVCAAGTSAKAVSAPRSRRSMFWCGMHVQTELLSMAAPYQQASGPMSAETYHGRKRRLSSLRTAQDSRFCNIFAPRKPLGLSKQGGSIKRLLTNRGWTRMGFVDDPACGN